MLKTSLKIAESKRKDCKTDIQGGLLGGPETTLALRVLTVYVVCWGPKICF